MSKTNIFECHDYAPMSDRERGQSKSMQSPGESRDAPLPGSRPNPALAVHNIEKSKPATGRRP
jgi:hypothetical protein